MSSYEKNPMLTICDDLAQVKGSVSQFQSMFNNIISKAPSKQEWMRALEVVEKGEASGEHPATIERLKSMIDAPYTKIAVRLRELHDANKLPLMGYLSKINLKTATTTDSLLGAFVDYNPVVDKDTRDYVGFLLHKDPPESDDDISYPPTLPQITETTILNRIVTDESYRQPSDFLESKPSDYAKSHNGRLAVKGRAVMYLCLTEILEESSSRLLDEDIQVIAYKLMSNQILSKFSFGYNLVDNMKFTISTDASVKEKVQVIGKLFLAYIGALRSLDYSLKDLKMFFKRLYEPIISDYFTKFNPLAKVSLAQLELLFKQVTNMCYLPTKKYELKFFQVGSDPFIARVSVNGQDLGSGISSISFEEAKYRAADDIMNNREAINKIWDMIYENMQQNKYRNGSTSASYGPGFGNGLHTIPPAPEAFAIAGARPTALPSTSVPLAITSSGVQPGSGTSASQAPMTTSVGTPTIGNNGFSRSPTSQQSQLGSPPNANQGIATDKQQLGSHQSSRNNTPTLKQEPLQSYPQQYNQPPPLPQSQYQYQQQSQPPQQQPGEPFQGYAQDLQLVGSGNSIGTGAFGDPQKMYIEDGVPTLGRDAIANNQAKGKFNTIISQNKLPFPEYLENEFVDPRDKNTKIFYMKIRVGTLYFGAGYGSNKKEAGHKAAMCALSNKEKLAQLGLSLG